MSTRTQHIKVGASGYIEDRTFEGAKLGELNQVPGADLFFTLARDISLATDNPTEGTRTISQSVDEDSREIENYTVHIANGSEGGEFSGCGFGKEIEAIAVEATSSDTRDDVINGAKLKDEQLARAHELLDGLARMITASYFDVVGDDLIEIASKNKATIVNYLNAHTADNATVDDNEDSTYDSIEANDVNTQSKPSYNVDPNHARARAALFNLDSNDADILARVLTVATVRVLSGRTITELNPV